ncbi:hypothetical protein ONZ45_g18447 [Pleurotus djamor]|nr:hypothetical protein ONZ45_g18447 [Pleurotus djamor]
MSVIEELPCNVAKDSLLFLGPFPLHIPAQLVVYYAEYRFIQALQSLYTIDRPPVLNTVLVRELEYVLAFIGWNHANGCYLTVGPATTALAKGIHIWRNPDTDVHTLLASLTARTACSTYPPQQHAIPWWSDTQVEAAAIADVDLPSSPHRLSAETAYFCVATWLYSLDAALRPEDLRRPPWCTQEMIDSITTSAYVGNDMDVQMDSPGCGRCTSAKLALSELAAESLIIEHHVENSAVALARSADGYYRLVQWLQTAHADELGGHMSSPVPTLDEVIACLAYRREDGSSPSVNSQTPSPGPHDAPVSRRYGGATFHWPSQGILSASLYPFVDGDLTDPSHLSTPASLNGTGATSPHEKPKARLSGSPSPDVTHTASGSGGKDNQ